MYINNYYQYVFTKWMIRLLDKFIQNRFAKDWIDSIQGANPRHQIPGQPVTKPETSQGNMYVRNMIAPFMQSSLGDLIILTDNLLFDKFIIICTTKNWPKSVNIDSPLYETVCLVDSPHVGPVIPVGLSWYFISCLCTHKYLISGPSCCRRERVRVWQWRLCASLSEHPRKLQL